MWSLAVLPKLLFPTQPAALVPHPAHPLAWPPGDHMQSCEHVSQGTSCSSWQSLVLTEISSGFSSAHPSSACLFILLSRNVVSQGTSFVLFSLYFHTFPGWALRSCYQLYTDASKGVKSLNPLPETPGLLLTAFQIFARLLHRSCTWLVPQRTYCSQPVSPSPLLFLNSSLHLVIL